MACWAEIDPSTKSPVDIHIIFLQDVHVTMIHKLECDNEFFHDRMTCAQNS